MRDVSKTIARNFPFAVLAIAIIGGAAPVASAQDEHPAGAFIEASAEAGEAEAVHEDELEHLRIRGVGDIFVIPEGLPEEIREEREHLRTQFIASVINFTALLALLGYVAKKKLRASLEARRNEISKSLDEARALKAEAEAKHAEYKKRLAALDTELASIREEMLNAGRLDSARIVEEAEKKAERLRRDTDFLIEQRMKSLKLEVTREAVNGAIDAAATILREKTTAEDQQRLSRAYVTQLASSTQGQGTGGLS